MENITIDYQPFPFLKYNRKLIASFPSCFADLTTAQFICIAQFINLKISETSFLEIMTGIRKSTINSMDEYQRYQLMLMFEPFTSVTPCNSFFIPSIKTNNTLLVSPKPLLAGMTFGQFIFIESYFESYQAEKKPLDLYKFVASLYLPQFRPFHEDQISAGTLFTAKVKPEILDAIVINYVLIKEWLSVVYPLLFQHEDTTDEKPKSHKNTKNNNSWLKIFESVVGDDLINTDKYSDLILHSVLRWMTKKIKENMKGK